MIGLSWRGGFVKEWKGDHLIPFFYAISFHIFALSKEH
ncbi:hypothetical protein PORCRE_1502 [Porphyromonas crevioricanis JCM 15906]|uniref:Uncharacterized protein n=1 Tax=Porphyromonas crevioricanis JCM 15906 TaxID=1305617 RepID=T1DTG2_9PORP|nr:hypothetical protein PORCRE_1502 [Porphyromonas crevioricanis JCM 15906]